MQTEKFKLSPGINNCSNEEYHGDKSYLSSSNLKLLIKDIEKFKKEFIDGEKEHKQVNAFDEGNYAHSLILEPENISSEYAFFPGFKKMGNQWNEFKAANSDKIMLSKPQKHRVEQWVESYKKRPEATNLISGGNAEYSLAGTLMDVPIKVRADYINVDEGYIVDVKTTGYDSDVDTFKHVVKTLSYDLSAALYCKMFEEFYKKEFDFYFVVLGKKSIDCQVYKISQETRERGETLVIQALNTYKRCLETNVWTNSRKRGIVGSEDYEILEV